MKKILLTLLCIFISFKAFAQEENTDVLNNNMQVQEQNNISDNTSVKDNKSEIKTSKKVKPDFNKKKISLDRFDERKWSLRVGYSYFIPDNKYLSMLQHQLKVGGSYDYNEYLQFQAFLIYSNGKKDYNISGSSIRFQGTIYNIGLLATGLYPFDVYYGSIAPFASIGAVYTFGNFNTTYQDGAQDKKNLSGGGILAQAGLQYSYNIVSIRLYGAYLYDFTQLSSPYIQSLSGFSAGLELGFKF